MEYGNEEEFISEIIRKAIKNNGVKESHTLIQIFKNVSYFNENHIHFIGKLEYKNYKVNFNYGFMFIEHPNYIIKLMGYFDGLYFSGTQHIIYNNPTILNSIVYIGNMKYNSEKRFYEKNGYLKTIKTFINNLEVIEEFDLFKQDMYTKKNFHYYHNNICEECQLNTCNILYLNERRYMCIHCDREIHLRDNYTRYYFENNDKVIINNRILINSDCAVYNINDEIFTKNSNGKLEKIELKKISNHKDYIKIDIIVKYIINNIDFLQLNEKYINTFIENYYKELLSNFSKYYDKK